MTTKDLSRQIYSLALVGSLLITALPAQAHRHHGHDHGYRQSLQLENPSESEAKSDETARAEDVLETETPPAPSPNPWPGLETDSVPNLQLFNPFNSPFRQANFVPDISLVMDFAGGGRSLGNSDFQSLLQPFNFRQTQDVHHLINPNNAFNFNYAELVMAAPVDPYVDLFSTFHLSAFEFEIEEAFAISRGLPGNFQIKAGKFLSHFGRLNPQHAHFWSFNEQPLINQAIFGNEGLN